MTTNNPPTLRFFSRQHCVVEVECGMAPLVVLLSSDRLTVTSGGASGVHVVAVTIVGADTEPLSL